MQKALEERYGSPTTTDELLRWESLESELTIELKEDDILVQIASGNTCIRKRFGRQCLQEVLTFLDTHD